MFPKMLLFLSLGLLLVLPGFSSPVYDSITSEGAVESITGRDSQAKDHMLETRATPSTRHFYNVKTSESDPLWEDMQDKGYRLISISIYGSSSSPRFAFVYKKEKGPKLRAIYNAKKAGWEDWVKKVNGDGYQLIGVSATGAGDDTKFAGLAEKGTIDAYYKCGLNSEGMVNLHQDQRRRSRVMKTVRQYGTSSNHRYCALWHGSPTHEKYTFFKNMDSDDFKRTTDAQLTKRYWHPEFISASEDGKYSAIYSNIYRRSTHWDRTMTAKELDEKVISHKNAGRFLLSLQARGSGSSARFSAIWVSLDIQPRTWRTRTGANSGVPSTFKTNIDNHVQRFMKRNSVRQGQFAIGKNGTRFFERAYTWNEEDRVTTVPKDRFYLASVSKPFAAAAAQALFDADKMTRNTKIVGVLDLPKDPADSRFKQITVAHLINHRAGFNRSVTREAATQMRQIALDMSGGDRPATMQDLTTWISRRQLDFKPGTGYEYANDGYVLLGRVIEKVSGREYYRYLRSSILTPESLDVGFYVTDPTSHQDDRVIQEDWRVDLSSLYPKSSTEAGHAVGGGGRYFESSKSFSSLTASAGTLTKFASKHALQGYGPRTLDCKTGSAPGARTIVCSTRDRVDWALVFSTADFPLGRDGDGRWDDLVEKIKDLVAAVNI